MKNPTSNIKTITNQTFRLAKKANGLSMPEKRALIAIADTCSMSGGVCRKSTDTINREYAIPARSFKYAIRGRLRPDGREYYPGLIARGIVTATEQKGLPTVYSVDNDRLASYSAVVANPSNRLAKAGNDTRAQLTPQPVHKETDTRAQKEDDPCTIDVPPVHTVHTSSKSSSKENSKASSNSSNPKTDDECAQKPFESQSQRLGKERKERQRKPNSIHENVDSLSRVFKNQTGHEFKAWGRLTSRLKEAIDKHDFGSVDIALDDFIHLGKHDWNAVKNPCALFLSHLDHIVALYKKARIETEEETAEMLENTQQRCPRCHALGACDDGCPPCADCGKHMCDCDPCYVGYEDAHMAGAR